MTDADQGEYEFDVALSFAGEDREYVEEVNEALKRVGVRTFLDSDYLAETWGEDLVEFFDAIYRKQSHFAMLFISRHYATKMWPREERRSALARAMEERGAYILPVRLDDTEIDGLRPTLGYIDARRTGIDGLVSAFLAKLSGRSAAPDGWPGDRVPRGQSEIAHVLSERPPAWEYLYFAGLLKTGKDSLEGKYFDHEMRYVEPSGERADDEHAQAFLEQAVDEIRASVKNLVALMAADVQERAFSAPGVEGDSERIKHLAMRWNSAYESLLDWSARVRGASHSERFDQLFELLAQFADEPIQQYRSFVNDLVQQVDRVPTALANNEAPTVELTLTVSIRDGLGEELSNEIDRLTSN